MVVTLRSKPTLNRSVPAPHLKLRRTFPALLGGFGLVLFACVFAQNAPTGDTYVGLGLWVRPAYEGAATTHAQGISYLRLYGDNLFACTTQGILEGGVQIKPTSGVALGA